MQAGGSQQPWGTLGLASIGLRNEAYKPMKYIAELVMNEKQRGAWPEISTERFNSYFSPPAGVYIQMVVEGIFGLKVHKPDGYISVSPSFPDHWPGAELSLHEYNVVYKRTGNTLEYFLKCREKLAIHVRWLLPVGRIKQVLFNDSEIKFKVEPRVGCILLSFDTEECTSGRIQIDIEPLEYSVLHAQSIAEGDPLYVRIEGAKYIKMSDRCGLIKEFELDGENQIKAVISHGLLQDYLKFGRLGLINFSRRTFFIYLRGSDGCEFWHPVDITLLPRYETAQIGEICNSTVGGYLKLVLRNNTFNHTNGIMLFSIGDDHIPVSVDIEARTEKVYEILLSKKIMEMLCPGDNTCTLVMPDGYKLDLVITVNKTDSSNYSNSGYFSKCNGSSSLMNICSIHLPEEALVDDGNWKTFRIYYAQNHAPWSWCKNPLEGISNDVIRVPGLPFDFQYVKGKLVPISWRTGKPDFRLDLGGRNFRKLYLLVIPFLDSHDMFAPVARLTVERYDGRLISKELYFPGDFDWYCPKEAVGLFATSWGNRTDRHGLLPILGEDVAEWKEAKPAIKIDGFRSEIIEEYKDVFGFPQPFFWSKTLNYNAPSCVMNVIELDLHRPTTLKTLIFSAIGTEPAFGLVAINGILV